MSNRKQRESNRDNARQLGDFVNGLGICDRCGDVCTGHMMYPPGALGIGTDAFYTCPDLYENGRRIGS